MTKSVIVVVNKKGQGWSTTMGEEGDEAVLCTTTNISVFRKRDSDS